MHDEIDESILDLMLQDPGLGSLYGTLVDKDKIRSLLKSPPEDLGIMEASKGMQIPKNVVERINIEVEPDGMVAWITLGKPFPGEEPVTENEIRTAVDEKHIVNGINDTYITRLAANPVYNKAFIIAKGLKPKDGVDGQIKYYFDIKRDIHLAEDEGGFVDYKEMNFVHSVAKGDLLCEILTGRKGTDGFTVTGKAVKASGGGEIHLPMGRNTNTSEDHMRLYAACAGEVTLKDGYVSVDKVLQLENVDVSTGNIRFIGSIHVKGRICEGFTVKATENIQVGEVIESADVSAGGNIRANRGIKGNQKGSVSAGGNISTPFIENMSVTAERDIYANVILNSNINCKGRITAHGDKGCILGGQCKAREVNADQLGNEANIQTTIEISGIDEIDNQIDDTASELNLQERVVAKLQNLMSLTSNRNKIETQKELLAAIYRKNELSKKKKQLESSILELRARYSFDVKVRQLIYPNVIIKIDMIYAKNMDLKNSSIFFRDGDHIVMRNYTIDRREFVE